MMPNDIARGGHGMANIAVLAVILSHGRCTASASTLARDLRCGEKTVRRVIQYWKQYSEGGDLINWHQKNRFGSTPVIEATFPNLATRTSTDEFTEGITRKLRAPRSSMPTKKNPEEKYVRSEGLIIYSEPEDPVEQDLTPEERKQRELKGLRGMIRFRSDFLETPRGKEWLEKANLTAEEVLASGSP